MTTDRTGTCRPLTTDPEAHPAAGPAPAPAPAPAAATPATTPSTPAATPSGPAAAAPADPTAAPAYRSTARHAGGPAGARTDVAVVGAGILGVLVAREVLSRDPSATVTVLDRDMIGSGATRRSAGLHFPRGADETVRALAAESERFYADLHTARPDLPIHPLGMTVLAPESAEEALRETYLPEAKLRWTGDLPSCVPALPKDFGAWEGDGCQYADVHTLTQLLAADLRPAVSFREGVAALTVAAGPGGARLTLSGGATLTAGHVVLAPGPWLAEPAWRELVAPLRARVKKVVALHVETPPAPGDRAVVLHEEDAFLLPVHHRGHWLFSYTCPEWDADPATVDPALTTAHLREGRALLTRYAPALAAHCRSGRVFCDAYGPDGRPLVTALDPYGRLVFAGAAGGSGYRLAPALAARAADLIPSLPSPRKATT
ncbi:glycine/D-amino acid oxidase-like deaminating enzyme [Streptomyces sp. 3211.6]|uniref:NAD(P)/FAD-dependent oxidoreductase n=1 Tax=Streptomyces sp. 3211.6 TaxID=1938845 RepID=UPI000F127080|nr:FAD-dependent oxidoreductase [Streptomyces sp. 3211.6]RKS97099.1 glycine/D-amino acid oxidase-like deaminating enzyme [Streptomyces sp. 3211.6]